jgi:hypothetical protein
MSTKPTKAAKPETATAERAAETAALPVASEQKATVPAEKAPKAAEKGGKIKVEFLRSHPEFGHFIGDKTEISREAFDRIQKDGPFFKEI